VRAAAGNRRNGLTTSIELRPVTQPIETGIRYVHLCCGDIIELSPVTGIEVTSDSVLVLNGTEIMGSYPRSEVYFLCDGPMEPPSLN